MKTSEYFFYTQNLQTGYKQTGRRDLILHHNLNVSCPKASLVALLGKNGVGKSTLLKTMAGLLPPLGGIIKIASTNIFEISAHDLSKIVSYVGSEPISVSHLTVRELVSLGRFPHKSMFTFDNNKDRRIVDMAMEMALVDDIANCWFDQLSDGQRQRVMIARALAQDTPVLLLDEPTSHLDLLNQYEILGLLKNLAVNQGKTILFTSHNLQISLEFCNMIWLMSKEKVLTGNPEDLLLNGSISDVFDNKRFTIDRFDGKIKLCHTYRGKVQLIGSQKLISLAEILIGRIQLQNTTQNPDLIIKLSGDQNSLSIEILKENYEKKINSFDSLAVELEQMFNVK